MTKTISMKLDKAWLLASLNAQTGASFTLVHVKGKDKQTVCIETEFLSKGGVTITLSRETVADDKEESK